MDLLAQRCSVQSSTVPILPASTHLDQLNGSLPGLFGADPVCWSKDPPNSCRMQDISAPVLAAYKAVDDHHVVMATCC